MRRNCNLTLQLVPPHPDDHLRRPEAFIDEVNEDQNLNQNQNQQLTIFYDGRVNVCEVTDDQAKAILKLASEEMDEAWRSSRTPTSPLMQSPVGLLMKKSLQRFLQKRNHRIQATSPYHHKLEPIN